MPLLFVVTSNSLNDLAGRKKLSFTPSALKNISPSVLLVKQIIFTGNVNGVPTAAYVPDILVYIRDLRVSNWTTVELAI